MRARLIAVAVVLIAGVLPASQAVADAGSDTACLVTAINADRAVAGLAALPVDAGLSAYAARHSALMASTGTIWHTGGSPTDPEPPAAAFAAAFPWTPGAVAAGENVGMTTGGCARLEAAFMGSPPHRANNLGQWSEFGVGVAETGYDLYATVDFVRFAAQPVQPPAPVVRASPSPVPSPARPAPSATAPRCAQ